MIDMSKVTEYVCDKYYRIVYQRDPCDFEHSVNGLLLNYACGNVVLLSEKGIYHIKYNDIVFMAPIEPPINKFNDEFKALLEAVN